MFIIKGHVFVNLDALSSVSFINVSWAKRTRIVIEKHLLLAVIKQKKKYNTQWYNAEVDLSWDVISISKKHQ